MENLLEEVVDERRSRRYHRIRVFTSLGMVVGQVLQVILVRHMYHNYWAISFSVVPLAAMIYVNFRYRDPKPFSEN